MRSMTSCKQAVLLAGHPRQDQSTSSDLEEQVQSTVDFESLEELEGGVAMRRASVFLCWVFEEMPRDCSSVSRLAKTYDQPPLRSARKPRLRSKAGLGGLETKPPMR